MALFHLRSLALLLMIFMFTIHPSNGEPLGGIDLVKGICGLTSDRSFCLNALIPDPQLTEPWPTAIEIATKALSSAERRADNARDLIARLLAKYSCLAGEPHVCVLLQLCQLHINKAIVDLWSANGNLNSNDIDAMVEDLNNAAVAAKTCREIIQGNEGIRSCSELANENDILIEFCEISLASTKFFPSDFNLP